MYKAILFDLDGTLTESGEGITESEKTGSIYRPAIDGTVYEICRTG